MYPSFLLSKHVLTEDILHREVTEDQKLLSRRLLTKTNRMPRWAERFFPSNVSHSVYILEDSIVDPLNRTMTTFTWNINHARLMVSSKAQPCSAKCREPGWSWRVTVILLCHFPCRWWRSGVFTERTQKTAAGQK